MVHDAGYVQDLFEIADECLRGFATPLDYVNLGTAWLLFYDDYQQNALISTHSFLKWSILPTSHLIHIVMMISLLGAIFLSLLSPGGAAELVQSFTKLLEIVGRR